MKTKLTKNKTKTLIDISSTKVEYMSNTENSFEIKVSGKKGTVNPPGPPKWFVDWSTAFEKKNDERWNKNDERWEQQLEFNRKQLQFNKNHKH